MEGSVQAKEGQVETDGGESPADERTKTSQASSSVAAVAFLEVRCFLGMLVRFLPFLL